MDWNEFKFKVDKNQPLSTGEPVDKLAQEEDEILQHTIELYVFQYSKK